MPVQIDRFGNMNLSSIGDHAHPKVQMIGCRGAPGNTINHPVSYWVPDHTPRVFVEEVDMVSGVGYRRASEARVERFHDVRRVITNKAVLDFESPDHSMRLRSLHPGVSVDDVVANTGFELTVSEAVEQTRVPTAEELDLIRNVLDPDGFRKSEVRA
jgi:acyl CoA:acetate/3-ketoacid CoA transferase beta subunit